MRLKKYAYAAAMATVLASCFAVAQDTPPALTAAIQKIASDPPNNRVLNELQAGTIALDAGLLEQAEQLFDHALVGINAVYANNEQAAKARGMWNEEGSKDYKGEPYERAMAFYYRGILDLYRADYENARAGFKSGLIQDSFAEEAQNRADFALLMFLDGWSSHLAGSKTLEDDSFAELQKFRPAFKRPGPKDNLLVIVETGKAPRKVQDGIGGNLLVYRQGKRFTEAKVTAVAGSASFSLMPMESIFWQASTRGGRPIDGILEGKIQFKQTTQNVSATVSSIASTAQEFSPLFGGAGGVFAGVAGVAGIATLATSGVKTKADSRYWNNLPDMVHVYTMPMPADAKEITLQFSDANGVAISALTQTRSILRDEKGNGIVWARSRRATEIDTQIQTAK